MQLTILKFIENYLIALNSLGVLIVILVVYWGLSIRSSWREAILDPRTEWAEPPIAGVIAVGFVACLLLSISNLLPIALRN